MDGEYTPEHPGGDDLDNYVLSPNLLRNARAEDSFPGYYEAPDKDDKDRHRRFDIDRVRAWCYADMPDFSS